MGYTLPIAVDTSNWSYDNAKQLQLPFAEFTFENF